ncbi:rhodanese-like domain-containing protein [Desulfococcaceae bacterium OttesenSCG-928-F15]|nr:rhodanese-like domain-containing protein [Desulfococcaceae bacterium OttesenSCG-928-F15]
MWEKTMIAMILGLLFFVLLGVGCSRKSDDPVAYKKISAAEAKAIMDSGEPYVLLDVRTKEEFQEGHIKGAVLIPYTEIKNRAVSELQDKDALILVYCRSGRRSAIAAKALLRMDYTRVYDFGSISNWSHGTVPGEAKP